MTFDDDIPFKEFFKGTYFGECDILFQRKRKYTAKTLIASHILSLSKQNFESFVVPEYPEIVESLHKTAIDRDIDFKRAKRIMKKYIN